ncbi:MAG: flagella cluster protein [Haloferacaceae archaeon]
MEALDLTGGFDVHEYREGLKVLRQDRGSMALRNRAGYRCPACGDPFRKLFVSTDPEVTFGSAPNGPICVARTDERLLVLTHDPR